MNRKLISILLVIVMIVGLFPAMALAGNTAASESPYEAGPAGDEDVAVMVYGKSISDIVCTGDYTLDSFSAKLKAELQGWLANEKLPEVEMYLVNDAGQGYRLTQEGKPKDAAFLSSFKVDASGLYGWLEYFTNAVQTVFGWLVNNVDTVGEFYRIYGATNVPEGDYTLKILKISGDGYKLWQPESGELKVHVGNDHVNYVGYSIPLNEYSLDAWGWNLATLKLSMPGVFLKAEEPGISFTSANYGGQAVPGAEFILVNRDEVENIVKAAAVMGENTFTNAMRKIGSDGFTWNELSILNKQLLEWDSENKQITLNKENARKLLGTYWALVEASSKEPITDFLNDKPYIHLPAILLATADENGIVRFTEDSNVTLVWSIQILLKLGNVVLDEVQNAELLDGVFENKSTEALVNFAIIVTKYVLEKGLYYSEKYSDTFYYSINEWVYPVLQNDNVMAYAKELLKDYAGDYDDIINMLPSHAILTPKMPAGSYILFQSEAPYGYVRSPLFYTVQLDWDTSGQDISKWCFASVADCGLILPYYAEDCYTYLREFDLARSADGILDNITGGKLDSFIQDMLNNDTDVTAAAIAYQSYYIYWYMGGRLVYDSQEALAAALTEYLYSYGRTAQNMMIFANRVMKDSKSVVTGVIDENWTFYNVSTSARTNAALAVQAAIKGVAGSIDTTSSDALGKVQQGLNDLADKIDTENHIADKADEFITRVEDGVKDTASKLASSALKTGMKLAKGFISWLSGK